MSKVNNIIKTIELWKDRINWGEYFMSIAFLAASRSSCHRLHVGCVLVKNTHIISMGYNGFLAGVPHTSIVRNNHEQATVHAEQNAISDAARRGVSVDNATAYITHYPCINCAKILAASGIKKIVYHSDYKNDEIENEIYKDTNIVIEQI